MAALMLASAATSVEAERNDPNEGIEVCWENMGTASVGVHFNGTSGTASVTVDRIFGVTTSLEATLTVYKKVGTRWVYVTSTSGSSSRQLNLEVDFPGVSGVEYKAEADIAAYGPNGSESDTIEDTTVC